MKKRARVKSLLDEYKLDEIVELADDTRNVVKHLNYFLYDQEPQRAWRASEAIGRLTRTRPDLVESLIDRFLWSINEESGSIGALAAETLGEMAGADPRLLTRIIPTMVHYLTIKATRRGSLMYMGRLGSQDPKQVGAVIPMVAPHLTDADPEVRAHACLALARMGASTSVELIERLKEDDNPITMYEQGELKEKTVGQVAAEALEILKQGEDQA